MVAFTATGIQCHTTVQTVILSVLFLIFNGVMDVDLEISKIGIHGHIFTHGHALPESGEDLE